MKHNFYKIGFFVLLAVIIVGLVFIYCSSKTSKGVLPPVHPPRDSVDITLDSTSSANAELHHLMDSVEMVKDSINTIVTFMNDSIDLRPLSQDQRNVYAQTFNSLARIKLHLDFKLDNARLKQLNIEGDKLQLVITKYDKKKEILNSLSNRLKGLASFIKGTIDVLVFAASKGIIVAPPQPGLKSKV